MAFFIGAFLVTIIVLIPLGMSLWQRSVAEKETTDSTINLYQTQLDHLQKDLKANLIDQNEYDNNCIEIQRRLLNSSVPPPPADSKEGGSQKLILISSLVLIPLLAIWIYAEKGFPSFTSEKPAHQWSPKSFSPQLAQIRKLGKEAASLSPMDKRYSLIHEQLGDLKAQIGLPQPALEEWKLALKGRFTPELALKAAEAETQQTGHVSPEALKLYHQALDAAPPDAPWRLAVETRIATGEHDKDQRQ